MKDLKSFTSVEDLKRTQAFYGPFKAPRAPLRERIAGWVLAIILGVTGAIIIVQELSK